MIWFLILLALAVLLAFYWFVFKAGIMLSRERERQDAEAARHALAQEAQS